MDIVANYPVVKSFLAGSFSGTFSTILFQPLDLVKTRLQNPNNAIGARSSGMITIFAHILKQDQLVGLWRGITPSITRCVPGVGLYFSSLHWLKSQTIGVTGTDPTPLQAVALGVVARTMSGAALIPITVIKTRFESGEYQQYKSVLHALRVIWKTEGVRGLSCGLSATLIRDAPFSGLYLMFYTQSKQAVPKELFLSNYASFIHFTCGVTSGVLASLVTHPADVIKTQMQIYPNKYTSVVGAIKAINKEHGFKGYFRGLAPRMLRRTLMASMAWTVYEQITRSIGLK